MCQFDKHDLKILKIYIKYIVGLVSIKLNLIEFSFDRRFILLTNLRHFCSVRRKTKWKSSSKLEFPRYITHHIIY